MKKRNSPIRMMLTAALALLLLSALCLTSCQGKANEAMALIEAGEPEEAFALLNAVEKPNKAERELMGRFTFIPVAKGGSDAWGSFTVSYEYNEQDLPVRRVVDHTANGIETTEFFYDDGNALIREVTTYSDGSTYSCAYAYDSEGRVISEDRTRRDGTAERRLYEYNEDGRQTRIETVYADGSSEVFEYVYDEKGDRIASISRHSDGSVSEERYTYNEKGYVEIIESFIDGKSMGRVEYTYDERNNLTKSVRTDGWGTDIVENTYDEKDRWVLELHTNADGTVTRTEYTYSEDGLQETCVFTDWNGSVTTTVREHDTYGNLLRSTSVDKDGSESVRTYEYRLVYYPDGLSVPLRVALTR